MERLTYVTEDGTVLFSPDGKDAVTITDISAMGRYRISGTNSRYSGKPEIAGYVLREEIQ